MKQSTLDEIKKQSRKILPLEQRELNIFSSMEDEKTLAFIHGFDEAIRRIKELDGID